MKRSLLIIVMMMFSLVSLSNGALTYKEIWVDITQSSGGDGSLATPYNNIEDAIDDINLNNYFIEDYDGIDVIIKEGMYRISETLEIDGENSLPIRIRGYKSGANADIVYVCGSEKISSSSWTNPSGKIYQTAWSYDWGVYGDDDKQQLSVNDWNAVKAHTSPELRLRRELVYVNNELYTQVLSENDLDSYKEFFIDETNNLLKIYRDNAPTANDSVEVPVRESLFEFTNSRAITLQRVRFRHANPFVNGSGVTIDNVDCVAIDSSAFNQHNSIGLKITNCPRFRLFDDQARTPSNEIGVRITNSYFNYNGLSGLTIEDVRGVIIKNSYANYNLFRLDWAGDLDLDELDEDFDVNNAGSLIVSGSGQQYFSGIEANYGYGSGFIINPRYIWEYGEYIEDANVYAISVVNCTYQGNSLDGITISFQHPESKDIVGPVLIADCTISINSSDDTIWEGIYGAGIRNVYHNYLSLYENTIQNNDIQYFLGPVRSRIFGPNEASSIGKAQNNALISNTFITTGNGILCDINESWMHEDWWDQYIECSIIKGNTHNGGACDWSLQVEE